MMYKRKVSLFLLVGALGLVFLTTSVANAACPDGMTSYWKLDEIAAGTYEDFINGNDGTGGTANPTPATGIVNGGQEFNGTDTEINVPADRSFGWYSNESFSIEYWLKRDDTVPSTNEVAVGRDDGLASSLRWWTGITTSEVATCTLTATNGDSHTVTGGTDVVDGGWHHVVVVRDADADELRIYVDGNEDATPISTTYGAGFESTSAELNIGWFDLSPYYHFEGVLDEVALYDRALTLTEIEGHYNNGVGVQDYCQGSAAPSDAPFPDDTISLWKLDEIAAGTYEDSFNGNDGTGGTANPTPATGIVNGGQEFNGTDTEINVPADRSFGWYSNESFSIEYWLKRDDTVPSTNEVAVGRDDGLASSLRWWTGITTSEVATCTLTATNGDSHTVTGGTDVVDGGWHHVVVVRDADADELRIYVDGNEDATPISTTYGAGFESTSAELNIGWFDLSPYYHFEGVLDEVALYDRALPLTEIEDHYDAGLAGHGIDYVAPTVTTPTGGGGGGGCFIATVVE